VRAQVGGREGGTLALFHHEGLDQESLLSRWNTLFSTVSREPLKNDLMATGRYRTMG
jgi:hypothetical protein